MNSNNDIRKVAASAGAEWMLEGFGLLKRSVGGLGGMGLFYGLVTGITAALMAIAPPMGVAMQLALIVMAPVLFAGLVWAAREVARGRQAGMNQYGVPLQQGKVVSLLTTLLPQIVLGLLMAVLLGALLGQEHLKTLVDVMQKMQTAKPGAPMDPQMFAGLPAGRILLWIALVCLLGVIAFLLTFIAIPDIMFGGHRGIAAMKRSFKACLHNLPAVIVFFLMMVITFFGLMIATGIFSMIVQLIVGEVAGVFLSQLLFAGVLMPVFAGAVYKAWEMMLGDAATAAVGPVTTAGQFQA